MIGTYARSLIIDKLLVLNPHFYLLHPITFLQTIFLLIITFYKL